MTARHRGAEEGGFGPPLSAKIHLCTPADPHIAMAWEFSIYELKLLQWILPSSTPVRILANEFLGGSYESQPTVT